MSESKYGRLFTEADVERLIVAARTVGPLLPGEDHEAWARACLLEFDGAFPADEPLFLLRGQDVAAPGAICVLGEREQDYASLAHLSGASEEVVVAACQAASAMREWQAANPDRVKVPT